MTPKVTLIHATPDAAQLLLFTKSTRLNLSPALMDQIWAMHQEDVEAELATMATTIRSSWEFVDLVFLIEGVTRATAQQITRTRNASYAMQSQRVTDASQMSIANPFPEGSPHRLTFETAASAAKGFYRLLASWSGDAPPAKLEDARGILPMNTTCNLICKYNLRAFASLIAARKSLRAQGEYNDIALQMEALAIAQWPWVEPFFRPSKELALELLEKAAKEIGINVGSGPAWDIAKAIDLLRKDDE